MDEEEVLKLQLEKLNKEHTELDFLIERMLQERIVNQVAVQRLKKQKLLLRDQILQVTSRLLPNIIA